MALFLCQSQGEDTAGYHLKNCAPPPTWAVGGITKVELTVRSGVYGKEQSSESLACFFFLPFLKTELLSGSPVIRSVCLWFISLRPFFLNVKSYKGWSVTSEHRFSSYIGHYRILSRFPKCYTVGSC